jgi:hypothetical protein
MVGEMAPLAPKRCLASALLAVAALVASSVAAQQQVSPRPSRFDFGGMDLGQSVAGSFTVRNPGATPVDVRLVPDGQPPLFVHVASGMVSVPASGEASVAFTYAVPGNATPGQHGETLRLVQVPAGSAGPPPQGALESATAVVFTSRTRAVGVFAIEAPDAVDPGGTLGGRVLVANTWTRNATVLVDLALLPASGGPAAAARTSAPLPVASEGQAAFAYSFGTLAVPPGPYLLQATLRNATASPAPLAAGAFTKPVLVGTRSASLSFLAATVGADGTVRARVLLRNTGSVAVALHPRLEATPKAGGDARHADLDPVDVGVGMQAEANGTLALPPGDYHLALSNQDAGGPSVLATGDARDIHVAAATTTGTTVPAGPAPAAPFPWMPVLVGGLVVLLVLALVGGFLLGRRGRQAKP